MYTVYSLVFHSSLLPHFLLHFTVNTCNALNCLVLCCLIIQCTVLYWARFKICEWQARGGLICTFDVPCNPYFRNHRVILLYLQKPLSSLESCLAQYLLTWNGVDYQTLIFLLVSHLQVRPFQSKRSSLKT